MKSSNPCYDISTNLINDALQVSHKTLLNIVTEESSDNCD